jgi:hypothetical protein
MPPIKNLHIVNSLFFFFYQISHHKNLITTTYGFALQIQHQCIVCLQPPFRNILFYIYRDKVGHAYYYYYYYLE